MDDKPNIPEYAPDVCPKCQGELEAGFGLVGGGYGVYMYCSRCGEIVSKTQVDD